VGSFTAVRGTQVVQTSHFNPSGEAFLARMHIWPAYLFELRVRIAAAVRGTTARRHHTQLLRWVQRQPYHSIVVKIHVRDLLQSALRVRGFGSRHVRIVKHSTGGVFNDITLVRTM